MNNDLLNTLVQRQVQPTTATAGMPPTPPPPTVPPPSGSTRLPTAAKRFNDTQQLQSAYANGWSPNPVLLQAMLGPQR